MGATTQKKDKTIKISGKAWALLRRAKYHLEMKNYSETIITLYKMLGKNLKSELKKKKKEFIPYTHKIRQKTPNDDISELSLKPKTIVLSYEAHSILQKIKIESDIPEFTLSDAIEFLVSNSLKIRL